MNKNCGIYKITSPSGKVYIGQSNNIRKRWAKYKALQCTKQGRIYNSFNKHGVDNHQFDIIEYCSEDELNCSERFWQDEFDVIGKNGLNGILQECGEKRRIVSQELKDTLSKINTGKKHTDETKQRMSEAKKGIPKSKETRKRMSARQVGKLNHFYGKKFSQEHRDKISNGNIGKTHTEEAKRKMAISKIGGNNITSRIVLDTQTGIFYYSIKEAAEAYGINYGTLRDRFSKGTNKNSLILV